MALPSTQRRKQVHQFKETGRTDPYRSRMKPRGLPACPQCGSVSLKGRWISSEQAKARKLLATTMGATECPACRQLNDRFALGVIELRGSQWRKRRGEVFRTLHNTEEIARARNDQERILWTQDFRGMSKIYVTLPELARRIGRELEKCFQGVAEYVRSSEEPYLRVRWWSDLPHLAHKNGTPLRIKRNSKARSFETIPHKSKAFRSRGKAA